MNKRLCTSEPRRRKEGTPGFGAERTGGTWKRYVAGNTAADFTVSLEKRRSELRDKHAHPDAGLTAASSVSLSDNFLPILKRPVQLEGQVRRTLLFISYQVKMRFKKNESESALLQ